MQTYSFKCFNIKRIKYWIKITLNPLKINIKYTVTTYDFSNDASAVLNIILMLVKKLFPTCLARKSSFFFNIISSSILQSIMSRFSSSI